jgi:transposase
VARRQPETLRYMGVDETSFQKRHEYVTVVSNLEATKVVYVGDDRKRESLDAFWVG